jgi:hypothetical protein
MSRLPLFGSYAYISDTPIACDSAGHLYVNSSGGTKLLTTAAPTTTPASVVLAANANRKVAIIRNVGTVDVYLGVSAAVTTANGFLLQRGGEVLVDDFSDDVWYGITASGTADLRIIEVS